MDGYFEFSDAEGASFTPDEVILFSGGLDSFAGAVEELVAHGKKVALVSHRSASKIAAAQKHLVVNCAAGLASTACSIFPSGQLSTESRRESTHRTRSFLFAALGSRDGATVWLESASSFSRMAW